MGLRFSIISGALTLVLLNLPLLVRLPRNPSARCRKHIGGKLLALGATKLQTIVRTVLPRCAAGNYDGHNAYGGKGSGETAILIFTAGTTVSRHMYDTDVFAAGETLAVHLWYLMSVGLVPDRDLIADGIGALLILTILIFNLLIVLPLKVFQRRMGIMDK